MTRLVLIRPHVHAGKPYAIGDRLDVDADIAEWLLAHDIAHQEPRPVRSDGEPPVAPRKDHKS